MKVNIQDFLFTKGKKLKKFKTQVDLGKKEKLQLQLQENVATLSQWQEKLYAESKQSLLIVFQGMDAAGKDSCIKNVFSGINPQGIETTSFKVPTATEYAHDFLWRHYQKLPKKGMMGIFNRSHYENVLVCKVHPEYILNENLKTIRSVKDVNEKFFNSRYEQINQFEHTLTENGTTLIKFMLHVSQEEQHKRFKERLENPEKNWKFSAGDFKESALWDKYHAAYEKMLLNTSKKNTPWYVIPCDNKSTAQLIVSEIVKYHIQKMKPQYPTIDKATQSENEAILAKL